MNTINKTIRVLVLAAALAPTAALAAYEEVGVGARVQGLGGAFTAVADDAYALHYNPAGLAALGRPELVTSYSKLLTGLSDNSSLQNSFLGYAHPLKEGRSGTVAAGWNYFTLDSLYRETSLYGSYGRAIFEKSMPEKLFGGVSLKYLTRSLGSVPQANQPIGPTGAVVPGQSDPVLRNASKSNVDLDWGVLYRPRPRWTLGLAVQHFLEPNIAFSNSDTDTLGRTIKLGAAYRTPFSTLAADLQLPKAPDGSTDKIIALAGEKWLPTLVHGTFGVRGALSVGSRSFRQVALGLSYKIHRLQFDYGFGIPLGGVTGTLGTHRLGITFRFGRTKEAQPTFAEAILENLRELSQVGTPEFRYQMEDLALFKRTAIEEFLRQAKLDVGNGRFADAREKLDQAASLKPADPKIEFSRERVSEIARAYPELAQFTSSPVEASVYEGALAYLQGKDQDALRKLVYAQSLVPGEERIETLIQVVEAKSGITRAAGAAPRPAPTFGAEKVVASSLALLEVAMREREYDRVLKLAAQVIELDPSNALAYKRQGAAFYALKRYPEALKALRSAQRLEGDREEKRQLRSYVEALAALVEKKGGEAAEKKAAEAGSARAQPSGLSRTPQQIERLYEAGVDLYAQGRLNEAAEAFRKILELDANNVSARRALDRVQAELLRGGDRR